MSRRIEGLARGRVPAEAATAVFGIASSEHTGPLAGFGGEALERRSIAEQVVGRIIGMIKSGNLKAGDRLPTERQMTLAFGISRPPLREALKTLTLTGVLESRQGGRYTVTDLSPGRLIAPVNAMLSLADCNAQEHFEARAAIDLQLVRLCAERAAPDERARIRHLAMDGRAFYDDPIGFRLLDIEFHHALHAAARHSMFFSLAQILYDVGLDARRAASAMEGVIPKSVEQHIVIAEAVMARDAAGAVSAYRRHLEHVRDTTLQSEDLARAGGAPRP